MKRRAFFQAVVALTTSALMPWKPRLPYTETMEDGWRVLRARTGDIIRMQKPLIVKNGERVRIASKMECPSIIIGKNAKLDVIADVRTNDLILPGNPKDEMISPEVFKRAADLFIEATCC